MKDKFHLIFQEMEPFLPWKSKCARFCVSITTVIFWVTELLPHLPAPSSSAGFNASISTCSPAVHDHGLHHRRHSVQASGVRCLREHHQRPHEQDPAGGQVHHAPAGHVRHRLLHQLHPHPDAQLLLREGGRLDHRSGSVRV